MIKRRFSQPRQNLLIFLLSVMGLALILMQAFAKPVWETLPLMKSFQFASRLMVVVTLLVGPIAANVAEQLQPKVSWFLIAAAMFTTLLNWGNRGMIGDITDNILRAQMLSQTEARCGSFLTSPKWFPTHKFEEYFFNRRQQLEIIQGEAEVLTQRYDSHSHQYLVIATEDVVLKENTAYFPQWVATDNQQQLEINYQHPDFPGLMIVELPPGQHQLEFKFVPSPAVMRGRLLSILGMGITLLVVGRMIGKKFRQKLSRN